MHSLHDKQKVLTILNGVLGVPDNGKIDEHIYYCPFCHHHKKKMNVNIENQKWHCWVCDAKGTRIYSLLKQLNVEANVLHKITEIYGNDYITITSDNEPKIELRLPAEFTSLTKIDTSFNPIYKRAMFYVKQRGITPEDIIKYNIGYCKTGLYAGRLIIPSYDEHGTLNYFIARTIFDNEDYKYKNPPVSKDIVALENQINWKEPITICEGMFDAMAIKRNAIPIFGKFIPKKLMGKIFENDVNDIYIMLDADAQQQALHYTNYFTQQGIRTKNIIPQKKDASEMGFSNVTETIRNTERTDFSDIISQKLKNL